MVLGNFQLTPASPKREINFNHHMFKTVYLSCNNTLADESVGVKAAPQQHLRVIVNTYDGHVVYDQQITVGAAKLGDPISATQVPLDPKANLITVIPGTGGLDVADQCIAFDLT